MPVRLSPLLKPSADVILVGDPRRAFALGQALTGQPTMSHLARGLWGYRGETAGGHELTVQATGIGGPSAVAVIAGLSELGARRLVRLGTCVAGDAGPEDDHPTVEAGQAFHVEQAIVCDGAARTLTRGRERILPAAELSASLRGIAAPAVVSSHDLIPEVDPSGARAMGNPGAPLRDLQTAATFSVAANLGIEAAAILVVVEDAAGERLLESDLEARFTTIGARVAAVLEGLSNP